MCGRFYLDVANDKLKQHFQLSEDVVLQPRYNIAPSQDIAAVRQGQNGRELVMLHWGLIPHWAKDEKTTYSMINARAETVDEKPSYRTPFKRQRCLIPASGFYEWQAGEAGKKPYAIARKDGEPFAMAGLWEHWKGEDGKVIESCTIIVTGPNKIVKIIHDRMPVILKEKDYVTWLDPEVQDTAALKSLLQPYGNDLLKAWPISRYVNNPVNDDKKCLEPLNG